MNVLIALIKDPDNSKEFISYILGMANDLNAGVHLLHILNPVDYPLGMPGTTGAVSAQIHLNLENRSADAKRTLTKLAKDLAGNTGTRVPVEVSTEIGVTRSIIDNYVSESESPMILLDNQGNDNIWSQDSTSMELIRHTDCPVWIIPHRAKYQPYNEIVYASDYNEEDIPTIIKLIRLTHPITPNITALHVTDDIDFETRIKKAGFQEMVQSHTGYDKITVKSLAGEAEGDLGLLIIDYASLIRAKLIVVLKENKHFLERIFKPDMTKKIIRQANIPVLIFHEKPA
jgi:nucleotide-binding universal stress UspA family protein